VKKKVKQKRKSREEEKLATANARLKFERESQGQPNVLTSEPTEEQTISERKRINEIKDIVSNIKGYSKEDMSKASFDLGVFIDAIDEEEIPEDKKTEKRKLTSMKEYIDDQLERAA